MSVVSGDCGDSLIVPPPPGAAPDTLLWRRGRRQPLCVGWQGGSGETRPGERDPAHRPGPPRTFLPARILPSQSRYPRRPPHCREAMIPSILKTRGSSMISGGGGTAGSSGSVTEGETGSRSETWNDGWIRYRAGSCRRKVTSLICLLLVKGPI